MNTAALANYYDHLQPLERLQLLLAAKARGDDVERDRLLASAPLIARWAPHHRRLGEALYEIASYHFMKLLAVAADYLVAYAEAAAGKPGRGEEPLPRWGQTLEQGYLFQAYLGGWQQFCADVQVELEPLWRTLPGYEIVRQAAELSGPRPGGRRPAAFSAEGVARYRAGREVGDPDVEVDAALLARCLPVCATGVAAALHAIWQEKLARLGEDQR